MRLLPSHMVGVSLAVAASCSPVLAAGEAAVTAQPERDPTPLSFRKRDASPADSNTGTVLLALGLAIGGGALVALRAGALRPFRLRRPAAQRAAIERLSTQILAKGSALHAVRWHGEELLIGCSEGHITLLARRADDATEQEPA
jgi:hypothetical protein